MAAARAAKLKLGDDLSLPLDVVSRRTTILGQTDTGKTSTAVVMVEEAAGAGAQFVVIDPTGAWWGLASNAAGDGPGVDCVVMGGRHGDVPLDEHAGREVAQLVADEGYNLVLDLDSLKSWAARQRFVADFCAELYERAHSQILVVIDEAHRVAPQGRLDPNGHAARCLGAVSDVVLLGRRRGLATLLVCQRPAKLNKDVLEMSEILIAHRVRGNNDRKALQGWVEEADLDVRSLMTEIAALEKGVAHVSAPTLDINSTHRIRPKRTFDSSRSIGVGEVEVQPQARAHVDMDALRERMTAVVERAQADDPKALRRRIKELEAQITDSTGDAGVHAILVGVATELGSPSSAEDGSLVSLARVTIDRLREQNERVAAAETFIAGIASDALGYNFSPGAGAARGAPSDAKGVQRPAAPTRPAQGDSKREHGSNGRALSPSSLSSGSGGSIGVGGARAQPASRNGDEPQLKAGARRILETLARHHPMRFTKAQVGTLTGFKVTGGTFQTYWGTLKRAGYVQEVGGEVTVLEAGLDRAGIVPEAPASTEEMVEMWGERLKKGARDMLDELVSIYPIAIHREDLAVRVGMTATGGTFQTYLGTLRRNGLVEVEDGVVRASNVLFVSGDAR